MADKKNSEEFNEEDNFFTRAGYCITHWSGRLILDENARKWAVIGSEEIYGFDGVSDVYVAENGNTGDSLFIIKEISVNVKYNGRTVIIPVLKEGENPCPLGSERYIKYMEFARHAENTLGWFTLGGGKDA